MLHALVHRELGQARGLAEPFELADRGRPRQVGQRRGRREPDAGGPATAGRGRVAGRPQQRSRGHRRCRRRPSRAPQTIPRSPGVATTSRQLSGPAIRSTARLAYGAARRVSIPAVSALPPVIASERWVPVDAIEQAPMRLAEERPCRGVGADRDGGRLVDLDERAAGGGELAEDRVEATRRARRTVGAPRRRARRVYGPCTACLTERSVSAAVVRQASSGCHSPNWPPSVIGSSPAALLGADGRLDQRLGRGAVGRAVDGAVPRGAWRTRIEAPRSVSAVGSGARLQPDDSSRNGREPSWHTDPGRDRVAGCYDGGRPRCSIREAGSMGVTSGMQRSEPTFPR